MVPKPTYLNDIFFKVYLFASLEGIEIGGHSMSCRQHVKTEGTSGFKAIYWQKR